MYKFATVQIWDLTLHKFATTNSNVEKIDYFRHTSLYNVDQSKPYTQIYLQIIASCIILQPPIVISFKFIISDMHHRITRTCILIFSKIALVDQSTPYTQICLQIIVSCINLSLPIVFFFKWIISDMHHRIMYMYINFQQNRVSRSFKTVHTNIFANNRKLHKFAIRISKNRSFQT